MRSYSLILLRFKYITGFSALLFLFTGIFIPLYTVPFHDSISLYHDSTFESSLILTSMSLTILFCLIRKFSLTWISCILYLITIVHFVNSLYKKLDNATLGLSFLKNAAIKTITPNIWGWIVLAVGSILFILTALPETWYVYVIHRNVDIINCHNGERDKALQHEST